MGRVGREGEDQDGARGRSCEGGVEEEPRERVERSRGQELVGDWGNQSCRVAWTVFVLEGRWALFCTSEHDEL